MKAKLINFLNPNLIILIVLFIFISCDNESDDNELSYETGVVVDIDGNTYNTVKIGNQWWMAENLKVTKYRNGDIIAVISDNIEWTKLTSGAYSWYQNDYNSKGMFYGALYNWYAIEDVRGCNYSGVNFSRLLTFLSVFSTFKLDVSVLFC